MSSTVLRIDEPEAYRLPLLFDSPHSGTAYPADFRPAVCHDVLAQAEDSHVDRLYASVTRYGATLLSALFPRSYIDVNRARDDIDPDLLAEPWPTPVRPSEKTKLGIGLIWRLVAPGVAIYERPLTVAEIQNRITTYYDVYHETLRLILNALHAAHGVVWYVDCHSMKAEGNDNTPDGSVRRPDIVLGDRFGTSCDPDFTQMVAAAFRDRGYGVVANIPYAGAELVTRYGQPQNGRHALQIEINRALYMDEATRMPHVGFTRLSADLDGIARDIAAFIRTRL